MGKKSEIRERIVEREPRPWAKSDSEQNCQNLLENILLNIIVFVI